ncbi:MAG TPA: FKBP-type peptidyl-prolyl cis-trans isomerase, partial [Myxococcota bacterium]|nr:FKBP-type peptidyl-prolyl cis-trans isomerase [Myxococcota bacterium]
ADASKPVRNLAPPVPIDVGRVPPVAIRSDSGLAWRVLRAGAGDVRPGPDDTVVVQWSGWLPDGTLLDSTSLRGAALELPLREAPPGWAEAIQQMAPGEKRRLWVPGALDGGRHPFGAGMLVYEIELMEIKPGSP